MSDITIAITAIAFGLLTITIVQHVINTSLSNRIESLREIVIREHDNVRDLNADNSKRINVLIKVKIEEEIRCLIRDHRQPKMILINNKYKNVFDGDRMLNQPQTEIYGVKILYTDDTAFYQVWN